MRNGINLNIQEEQDLERNNMATPIQYIPQYVPMDIGTMSDILDRKQAKYNEAYAAPLAFEDAFSQIDVGDASNIAGKNAILGKFQNRIQEIVDRYGGDYGAASEDIAREISKERSNPFYQLAPKAAEAAKQYTLHKKQLGDFGFEKTPLNTQFLDEKGNIINSNFNYELGDIRYVDPIVAAKAEGYAKGRTGTINRNLGNGWMELGSQYGFKNQEEAAKWLNTEEGNNFLNTIYPQLGIQSGSNEKVDNRVRDIALSALVGKEDVRLVEDNNYIDPSSGGTSFDIPELKFGVPVEQTKLVDTYTGERAAWGNREAEQQVGLVLSSESSLNPTLNESLGKYYPINGRSWVFGTSSGAKGAQNIPKKGQENKGEVSSVTDGSFTGVVQGWEIVGQSSNYKDEQLKINDEDDEDLGKGSLLILDKKGRGQDSPIGVASDDKNFIYPKEEKKKRFNVVEGTEEEVGTGKYYAIKNSGTPEERKIEVRPVYLKRIQTPDMTVYEEASRTDRIRTYGNAGSPLVQLDEKGRWVNYPSTYKLVELYNADIKNKAMAAGNNSLPQMIDAVNYYLINGISIPQELRNFQNKYFKMLEQTELEHTKQLEEETKYSSMKN